MWNKYAQLQRDTKSNTLVASREGEVYFNVSSTFELNLLLCILQREVRWKEKLERRMLEVCVVFIIIRGHSNVTQHFFSLKIRHPPPRNANNIDA